MSLTRAVVVLVGGSLVGCGSTAPGSFFPPIDDESADAGGVLASSGDAGAGRDDANGANAGPASDAGSVVVVPPLPAGECAGAPSPTCSRIPGATTALNVEGFTPFGTLVSPSIAASYTAGFTESTNLTLFGTLRGRAFAIHVAVSAFDSMPATPTTESSHVVSPGRYADNVSIVTFQHDDGTCPYDNVPVDVTIVQHSAPDTAYPGDSIDLEGNFDVVGAGWDLHVKFAIRRSCGFSVDI